MLLIAVGIKRFRLWIEAARGTASVSVVFDEAAIIPGLVKRCVVVWLGDGGGLSCGICGCTALRCRSALNKATIRQSAELLPQFEPSLLWRLSSFRLLGSIFVFLTVSLLLLCQIIQKVLLLISG